MKDRRSILTIALFILVLVLGGASVYMALRLSTPKPIAPTAPDRPQAFVPEEGCVFNGGSCTTSAACTSKGWESIGQRDCSSGLLCCKQPWLACNVINFSIACEPRPVCLDSKTEPCTPQEPANGWCPYLSCNKKKNVYKNDPRNTAGTYYLENKISEGGTVYLDELIVISIPYKNVSTKKVVSAVVSDTLSPKLTYVDGSNGCSFALTQSKVVCNIGEVAPNGSGQVSIRARVKATAQIGELNNTATITTNEGSGAMCYSQQVIQPKPEAVLSCTSKIAETTQTGVTQTIEEVTKGQVFSYTFKLENKGNAVSTGYVLRDILKGDGKDNLVFIDSADGCTYGITSRLVSCPAVLEPGATKTISFKVKVGDDVTDGLVVKNKAYIAEGAMVDTMISECTNSVTVKNPAISAIKKAYKDSTANSAGSYSLSEEINTVSRGQMFVYTINMNNSGSGRAEGVSITDGLNGEGQENLSFIDSDSSCTYANETRTVTCTTNVEPNANKNVSFRVKVNDTVVNGTMIKNTGIVKLGSVELTVKKDLSTSSVVSCNQACNLDSECGDGLKCDTASKKCRDSRCVAEISCVCPVATTPTPITVITNVPTAAPTTIETPIITQTPAPTAVAVVTPEILPETGILDTPGLAAFGGGLFLAIIGILLAL